MRVCQLLFPTRDHLRGKSMHRPVREDYNRRIISQKTVSMDHDGHTRTIKKLPNHFPGTVHITGVKYSIHAYISCVPRKMCIISVSEREGNPFPSAWICIVN